MKEASGQSGAPSPPSPAVRVVVARGARRAEARLVEAVRAWHAAVRADPARLARPLHVLVPSKSLKEHVSAVLVGEIGALAGVAVQTHHAAALQILERAGLAPPAGSELFGVLVRRAGEAVPALRGPLHDLDDGYGAVAADVSDLLDAGLDEATAPAVEDLLAGGARGGPRARAAGVVRVALGVRAALRARGLGRLADVIDRARAAVEADPALWPAGGLLLHGFADVTGLVADFLATVLRASGGTVLLDRPPDPAAPERPDLGAAFGRSFLERMAALPGTALEEDAAEAAPVALDAFRAPGSDAEVRAVGRRILALLAADAPPSPERIGIVTRTPSLHTAPLRVQLERLGVPFSGVAMPGPRSAVGRRIAFVLALLRERERLPADRFVLALRRLGPGQRVDLRLGLHALGLARLGDLAREDATDRLGSHDSFPLPVRRGLSAGGEPGGEGAEGAEEAEIEEERRPEEGRAGPHARRRHLQRRLLAEGSEVARAVCARLGAPEAPRPLVEWLATLRALLVDDLGWRPDGEAAPLFARLATLAGDLPPDLDGTLDELALVLERALDGPAHERLGGAGGGVQVLDVIEARGRTFEHLFLVGLNRDHFPRVIAEDPLLPDDLRRELQAVLPDLPVKERGHDEERFLFAELLSASPNVTLSWQVLGDDGKAKAPSPLVERLLAHDEKPPLVPTAFAAAELAAGEHPAHEWALLAGLHGAPSQAAALLPAALAEAGLDDAEALAAVRGRAVGELDGRPEDDALLGPWLGHVGPPTEKADLRSGDLFVTHVEAVARCPWRGFLTRLLRLERPPDALEALPEADVLLVGSLVHAVLERIVQEHVPEAPAPAGLSDALGVPVPWPEPARVAALTEHEAHRLLHEHGIGVPGFAALLAEYARPYLEAARRSDWAEGPVRVVGAEVQAEVEVPTRHGPRRLCFRADRVDRVGATLHLTDYKAGKPISEATTDKTRAEHFRKKTRAGLALQAASYARLARGAHGRFLYLKPEVEDGARAFAVGPEDEELLAAHEAAVSDVVGALDAGTFVPRLADAKGEEPDACSWCEVAMACVRGDSGARRRLADWAAAPPARGDARAAALRAVWAMGEGEGEA